MREHRVGMVAWVVGGALAMLVTGLALSREMQDFPGGAQALADSVLPAAEAMRPLRWPAERLDTLGGYLTYHNVILFSLFLSLYAAIQGSKALRRWEEGGALEQVLATGWPRGSVVRDRVLGFVVVVVLITLGLAAGVAMAMAAAGAPDLGGSVTTLTAVGLAAFAAYSLALLVSQVVRSSRTAAGVSVTILLLLYVGTNVWEDLGPAGALRFVSPFYWANQSRALVPGHGLDLAAMLAVLGLAAVLLALAALAFDRRDYGRALWVRRHSAGRPGRRGAVRPQHWWLDSIWIATLARHRIGLIAWAVSAAAFAATMMALQPRVMEVWSLFDFMTVVMGGGGGSAATMYASFAADVIAPVVVAYVVTQAAGWPADLDQGRVEAVLSVPVSWSRLVGERVAATVTGVAVVSVAAGAALAVGGIAVGAEADPAGLVRTVLICTLLGWSVAAVAALAVAGLRSGVAVTVLAVYVGTAYLLAWFVPIFDWPDWVMRLSVFEAFGHPYQAWPDTGSLLILLGVGALGSAAAAAVAERTPKVA